MFELFAKIYIWVVGIYVGLVFISFIATIITGRDYMPFEDIFGRKL